MMDLKPCPYGVAELLPQKPPMLLLDEIVGWCDERIVASVTVRPDSMFLYQDGVPAHIAIEWMAQTCGAMVGLRALEKSEPVRIGFLLGTRDFSARVAKFRLGDKMAVTASPVFSDGPMAVFECQVERAGQDGPEVCATARLNLFQPESLEAILKSQGLIVERE
jgi:predicted hotdog family 3-hydroxylacyl-ACP dehydratase